LKVEDMASAVMNMTTAALDWVTVVFDAPLARAVVFGVHIDGCGSTSPLCWFSLVIEGHLVVEVLLVAVILFQLTRKSYKPPKKPLTEKVCLLLLILCFMQEIDDLCEEWVPEPLYPPITEEMKTEPPVLESAAGPHTVIDGKEVVNFASANYLGLLGNENIAVRINSDILLCTIFCYYFYVKLSLTSIYVRIHVSVHWRNMVLVLVVLVAFMEQ
ncbi:hypothetical protein B296_00054356, partial [Ensete ventricosum]